MRKVTVATVLALVLGAGLSGCTVIVPGTAAPAAGAASAPVAQATSAPPPAGLFDDPQGRFGLVPPSGWTVDTSGARGTAAVFLDPEPTTTSAGRFSANINVLVLPATAELAAAVSGARQELTALPGYRSVADEPFTLTDGTPGHKLGGTFDDQATGLPLRNLQVFAVDGERTTVVTGTSVADRWADYESTITESLQSLRVKS